MKQVVLIALLAGAAAGAGGAVVTTVLTMPVETAQDGAPALVDDGSRGLGKEIAELRRENELLFDRLKALEERPALASATRVPAAEGGVASFEELERKVEELEAAWGAQGGAAAPPSVRATIRAELQSIADEEERQREIDREARRLERVDERIEELSKTLALDAGQARQMRDVLLAESTRRDELMSSMREGGDWASGREQFQALRQELEASLTAILTPDQFQKYQESEDRGFGGRFGGDRRRDNGGGDRGGRGRDRND